MALNLLGTMAGRRPHLERQARVCAVTTGTGGDGDGIFEQGSGGLWSFLSVLLPFLFVLTIVVFVHELGHFLVARWCGVKVKAFSIGFGTEIFGFYDRYGTRWRFAWIPLGGYVKFLDDENSASVPSRDALERHVAGRAGGRVPVQVSGGAVGHRRGRADRQFPAGDCRFLP